jgi:hypothetical protein
MEEQLENMVYAFYYLGYGVLPRNIAELIEEAGVAIPDFMVDAVCEAHCKNGKRCRNAKSMGLDTCLIHSETPILRTGTACAEPGCKAFVKQWAPLCYSHAKKAGLVQTPEVTGECPICYSEMSTANERSLHCGHAFHAKCVGAWFSNKADKTCPMCRVVIT